MIKAIIIDDEQHCIDRLVTLLKPHKNTVKLVGQFTNVKTGIDGVKALKPNVLFLDVQIHDSTGFDVLRALGHFDFEVIFTTSFEKYAVQAFKFSATDYLLKPIDKQDFDEALEKLYEKIEARDFSKKVEHLLANISQKDNHKKIAIPTAEGLEFLDVSDIIRCESDVNYTLVYTTYQKKIVVSKTLKWFENLLGNCNFFRVHNSHLINLDYIKKYTKGKGGYVTLTDNSVIEVSTRKKEGFLKVLNP
ncbi:LytR/AlgR family response regulator transcription factor [Hwangdonia lutea]|uniref:LytTR family DNA-binding domain-containing protein n=1 Tax=Hwangdonia lutea TaxID=3075823 RepID=A0AA97ENI7_9FLAO|nr:LytTR family DNA-binding domain-containing protein [Hwangdonia sp. SCSIO 19198]WOD43700.1 LytTR family DNA-binding domain-containing protein [Hwangdonia sp. SCSIO 19198]